MRLEENNKFYKIQMVIGRIRHGLFLYTLRNFLNRFGLDIAPYYWVQEGKEKCNEPKIKGDFKDYRIEQIAAKELKIMNNVMGLDAQELEKDLNNGQICVGLKQNDTIAAVMFVQPNDFDFKHRSFKLADNEAYLLNMYTFQTYRGKNLAPFLRYHCYKLMEGQNKDVFYSITSYFNKSSQKFKQKLNAKNTKLYLHIGLFKKWHWNFTLRKYAE